MNNQHAIVLGASMGGLLAARVLSEHFVQVTVLDRDRLPSEPAPRRGVPQSNHGHTIWTGGSEIIGELFPGLLDELVAAGTPTIDDDYSQMYFVLNEQHINTNAMDPAHAATMYTPSRGLLEHLVRQSVAKESNVDIQDGVTVTGLLTEDGNVSGVTIDAGSRTADLVVDCMGRAARTPAWLESMGYDRPPETTADVDVAYSTSLIRLRPGTLHEKLVFISPTAGCPRAMLLFQHEQDTCEVVALGIGGVKPPTDRDEFLDYLAAFAPAHIVEALRESEQLAAIHAHRFHQARWRRYDKMRRFPDGLLAFGDAVCSFNPAWGQGMTTAAKQALCLREALESGLDNLAPRVHRSVARTLRPVWTFNAESDRIILGIEHGEPSVLDRITAASMNRFFRAASQDGQLAQRLLRVVGMLESPTHFLAPSVGLGIAAGGRSAPSGPPAIDGVRRSFVDARGVRFHVTEAGSGLPVLALHGWPQHHYEYRDLLADPPEGMRIIAPDLPGYGWSGPSPHQWRKDDVVADILALMDEMELDKVVLVGHDWGGWLGHLLTLEAPERFEAYLALSITHPWVPPATLLRHSWKLAHMPVNALLGMPLQRFTPYVRGMLRLTTSKRVSNEDIDVFADRFHDPACAKAGTDTYRTFVLKEIPAAMRHPETRRSTVPTRAVIGSRDVIHPELASADTAKADDYTREIVDGVGHFLVDERPELVRARLIDLVTSRRATSSRRPAPLA